MKIEPLLNKILVKFSHAEGSCCVCNVISTSQKMKENHYKEKIEVGDQIIIKHATILETSFDYEDAKFAIILLENILGKIDYRIPEEIN